MAKPPFREMGALGIPSPLFVKEIKLPKDYHGSASS